MGTQLPLAAVQAVDDGGQAGWWLIGKVSLYYSSACLKPVASVECALDVCPKCFVLHK